MPTTPLQRLIFLQGSMCFFCNRTIPKDEWSVEHLVPVSQKGGNEIENLVACCRTLNGMFGHLTLKEKLSAILKQKGKFVCPNEAHRQPSPQAVQKPPVQAEQPSNVLPVQVP
jgi:hypothetical protein